MAHMSWLTAWQSVCVNSMGKFLLGKILVDKNLITLSQLEKALALQRVSGDFLGAILVNQRYIKEEQLLAALSEQFNMPLAKIDEAAIDWQMVEKFPKTLIVERRCFPVAESEFSLTVAINNPLDADSLSLAEKYVPGKRVKAVLVTKGEMDRALELYQHFLKEKMNNFFKR